MNNDPQSTQRFMWLSRTNRDCISVPYIYHSTAVYPRAEPPPWINAALCPPGSPLQLRLIYRGCHQPLRFNECCVLDLPCNLWHAMVHRDPKQTHVGVYFVFGPDRRLLRLQITICRVYSCVFWALTWQRDHGMWLWVRFCGRMAFPYTRKVSMGLRPVRSRTGVCRLTSLIRLLKTTSSDLSLSTFSFSWSWTSVESWALWKDVWSGRGRKY